MDGNGDHDETWAIFVRNFGNEGGCGGSQHFLGLTQFVPFAWPAPGPGIVGRGPPAVHSVVDTAKTRRDEALRNFVCKVASDTGQRPESCREK